jgi:hypothetical protein
MTSLTLVRRIKARPQSHEQGWTGSLDKLEAHLAGHGQTSVLFHDRGRSI